MRPEYQRIVDEVVEYHNVHMGDDRAALVSVAARCEALADRPVVHLIADLNGLATGGILPEVRLILDRAITTLQEQQAKIDRLMLEYCPKEMTPEQVEEWGRNQRRASPTVKESLTVELPDIPGLVARLNLPQEVGLEGRRYYLISPEDWGEVIAALQQPQPGLQVAQGEQTK